MIPRLTNFLIYILAQLTDISTNLISEISLIMIAGILNEPVNMGFMIFPGF
jgi:hypothetical protein